MVGGTALDIADLMVEDVCQRLGCHALTSIADGQLHIVVTFLSRYGNLPATACELAGVVGQRVEHEQRQYAVGFHG